MIETVRGDPSMGVDPPEVRTKFLNFLEEMQNVLGRTLGMVRDVGNRKIVLNAAERTDKKQKSVLTAALRTAWRRCKSGTERAPADLVETALRSTPAQLVKQDLQSIMNEYRRNDAKTINTEILQDCLVAFLRELDYQGDCAGTAELVVQQLTLADEPVRVQLLDQLLAAIHNVFDGAERIEAEERLNQAYANVLNGRVATAVTPAGPHPLSTQLSRRNADPLAVLGELLRLHPSGKKGVDDSMFARMSSSKLSQALKNMMSYEEIHNLVSDLIEMLERLQPIDPEGHSDHSRRGKRVHRMSRRHQE